jgi:phospholipase/carboxylesterase
VAKRALPFVILVLFIVTASSWLWMQGAPLSAITRGGSGPPTIVLLHGYGSRAEDWLQFEAPPSPDGAGAAVHFQFPARVRRVYLQAPLRGPWSGQRGWWWLHLESYVTAELRMPDLSHAAPGGIKVASQLVRQSIRAEAQPLVLGGFSQGAMTSAEIAFQTDQELAGLILLSGTTVNEEAWAEHFAGRRRLPIFIAHGRHDAVLPFAIMDRFQQRLKAFGSDVTWLPFDGGHEIPPTVVDGVNRFVRRVLQLESSAGRN